MKKLKIQGSGVRVQGSGFRARMIYLFIIFLFIFLYPVPCTLYPEAFAKTISSTELIEHAREYNNQVVEYEGEAIGDVMIRGGFAWVNVNDGQNAVGIWGQKDQVNRLVKCKGYYKRKGDIVNITGEFHRACPAHGGDMDIHMIKGSRIRDGFLIERQPSPTKMKWAGGLAVVALGLAALTAIRSRKK
jgi:hypothetical protein